MAKRGKQSGAKQVYRCRACTLTIVAPASRAVGRCACGGEYESLLKPLIRAGRVARDLPPPRTLREHVIEQVRRLLSEAAELSRQESGCVRFEVYQSQNEPTKFLLHERWESKAALDRHRTERAYTTIYQPRILPLINREGHPSELVSG